MGLLSAIFGSKKTTTTTQQTDARSVTDASAGGIVGSTITYNITGFSPTDAAAWLSRSNQPGSASGPNPSGTQAGTITIGGQQVSANKAGMFIAGGVALLVAAKVIR